MILKWLRFFRIVNLPTVPGDVLVGCAAAMAGLGLALPRREVTPGTLLAACLASCFLYLWGLADNDIVGAKTDTDRPIPNGEISLGAARVARALCLIGAIACSLVGEYVFGMSSAWQHVMGWLLVAMIVYNRTKWSPVMGLCRGLNVLCGVMAVTAQEVPSSPSTTGAVTACLYYYLPPLIWTLYIWFVTKMSEGEETNPMKKQLVGALIGGLVYLQLAALVVFAVIEPATNKLLIAGAVLLIVLRFTKRLLPKVSAS